jgi:hypothetical protein
LNDSEQARLRESVTATATADAVLTVDEDDPLHATVMEMLGVQYESSHRHILEGTDFAPEFQAFAPRVFDFPLFRYGGAAIEETNLILNIGQMNTRSGSARVDGNKYTRDVSPLGSEGRVATNMGPLEFVKLMRSINPNGQYLCTISVTHATPEDNANLAAFLTHEAGQSEWGALRAMYGMTEPVNVFAFELGNEIDSALNEPEQDNVWAFSQSKLEWYSEIAPKHIAAIRAAAPEAKFVMCGKTAPWSEAESHIKWTEGVARAIGADCDYLAFHPYYDGMSTAYMSGLFDDMSDALERVLGAGHGVKFLLTEHARFADEGLDDAGRINLFSALSTAQFFNVMMKRGDMGGATYHSFFDGGEESRWWGLAQYVGGTLYQSPVGQMYHVYAGGLGDRVVRSVLTSDDPVTDETDDNLRMSALVTAEGGNRLKIILVNMREDLDFNIAFDLKHDYTLKSETVFTAPNTQSFIYSAKEADIVTAVTTERNTANFKNYHMPNKSLAVLTLETAAEIAGLGGQAGGEREDAPVETAFADIDGCWARNEIAKMTDLGFIQGKTATVFAPYEPVTRAEFAVMLARVLGLGGGYPKHFTDVPDGAWYADGADGLFYKGVLKGKREAVFAPDDQVTAEEIAAAANRAYRLRGGVARQGGLSVDALGIKDLSGVSAWAREDVLTAIAYGLFARLYENGYPRTNEAATRAEAASILYRLYNAAR